MWHFVANRVLDEKGGRQVSRQAEKRDLDYQLACDMQGSQPIREIREKYFTFFQSGKSQGI